MSSDSSTPSTVRQPEAAKRDLPSAAAVEKINSSPNGGTQKPSSPEPNGGSDSDEGLENDCIDWTTFQQILELDDEDDEEREFSGTTTWGYFEQAQETFAEIEAALKDKNLDVLRDKGHFLKGSSAALGIHKVQDICELIQNTAKDAESKKITEEDALKVIAKAVPDGKRENEIAKKYLKNWFLNNSEFEWERQPDS